MPISCAVTLGAGLLIEYEPYLGRWMDIITIYVVPVDSVLGAFVIYWMLGVPAIKQQIMTGRTRPLGGAAFSPNTCMCCRPGPGWRATS